MKVTGNANANAPASVRVVVFDMDGVLVDSEQLWERTREELTRETGGTWRADAQRTMMGMSTVEWTTYMHDALGVPLPPEAIAGEVIARLVASYRARSPLIAGAREAVHRLAARWPLAVASSSPRALIDEALRLTELAGAFAVTVSSEEVARGKPAPDVYLEALRRLGGVAPGDAVGIEDSTNGIYALGGAGIAAVAVPNAAFPPAREALASAAIVLGAIGELDADVVVRASRVRR